MSKWRQLSSRGRPVHGMILVTVCWCVLILTLVVLYQMHTVEMRRSGQRAAGTDFELRTALLSVENQIIAAMENDMGATKNDWDAPSESWGWYKIRAKFEKTMQEAYPDIELTGAIEDEDSKVSLKSGGGEALQILFQKMGRGEMESERLSQAVSECLQEAKGETKPTEGKSSATGDNIAYPDIRFLLKIPIFNKLSIFGEDTNFNQVLDPNENDGPDSQPADNRDGVMQFGIGRFLSLCGDGKINPNFAPLEVLETVPGVTRHIAEEIVWKRNGTDGIAGTDDDFVFQKTEDLKELHSLSKTGDLEYNRIAPQMRVTSNTFVLRLCATGRRGSQRHRIQMIVKRGKEQTNVLSRLEDFGS